MEAPTPCLQKEDISKVCLPWKNLHPICISYLLLCNKYHKVRGSKQHTFIISHSPGAGVCARLSWNLCSQSHKATIMVLAGLRFFLELGVLFQAPVCGG